MGLSERQVVIGEVSLERMVRAVEKVRDRLLRAAKALDAANIPYAVAGGNAVAAWVARVDEAAVRNTQDVDIILRRGDLEAAKAAMAQAGFVYRHVKSIDMFLDGSEAKARDAVRILFAGEKVRQDDLLPVPELRNRPPIISRSEFGYDISPSLQRDHQGGKDGHLHGGS